MEFEKNILTGREADEIDAYFGQPAGSYPGLNIYKKDDTVYYFLFGDNEKEEGKSRVTGYAWFSGEKKLSQGVRLLDRERVMSQNGERKISEFVSEYGRPHADIGNGRAIPVYITEKGTVVSPVLTDRQTVTGVRELDLHI